MYLVGAGLKANPEFHLVSANAILERQGVKLKDGGEFLRLYPHIHETDGFFAAVLERDKTKAGTPMHADAPPIAADAPPE